MMRRTVLAAMLLALLALAPAQTYGQDEPPPATMPSGWQQLDAEAFAATCEELFKAKPGPTAEHVKEVVAHAWSEFLNDEEFVNTGAWADVHAVTAQFAHRRNVLVTGTTPEEKEASTKAIDEQFTTLKTRLAARIEANPAIVNDNAFNELLTLNTTLNRAGFSHAERVAMFAQWMDNNEWGELPADQQAHLFAVLDVDLVNRADMSVRWTGSIKAPATGEYTFVQLRQFYEDSDLKVWIGGELVLDSSAVTEPEDRHADRHEDDPSFRSQPVALTAGQAVSIQVELRHKVGNVAANRRYPMAVLMWESAATPLAIIPSSAYTPPAGFGPAGSHGLKGEYYGNSEFEELKHTRLDPALDFVWSDGPAANLYDAKRKAILEANWSSLMNDGHLAGLEEDARATFVNGTLLRFLRGMTATQRSLAIGKLTQHANLLEAITIGSLSNLVRPCFMLPHDEPVDFVGAWAAAVEQPQTRIGYFPGWGRDRYRSMNHDSWWVAGRLFQGPYSVNAIKLRDRYLKRSDGTCNLHVAYILSFVAKIDNWGDDLRKHFDEILANEQLVGDTRATWLLGRAYAAEVAIFDMPRPDLAIPNLEDAFAAAEGQEMRFWTLQELVARLVSTNQSAQALSLLDSIADQFQSDEQRKAIAEWREKAEEFTSHYKKVSENKSKAVVQTQIRRMKQKVDRARGRGDHALAATYQARVDAMEASQNQE